jgi:hypothetical protein
MVKGGEIDMNTMVENMMTFTGAGYDLPTLKGFLLFLTKIASVQMPLLFSGLFTLLSLIPRSKYACVMRFAM